MVRSYLHIIWMSLGPANRRILAHILSSVFISFIINVYLVCLGANKNETSSNAHTVSFFNKTVRSSITETRLFCLKTNSVQWRREEVKDSLSKNNNNKKPPPSYGWCGGMVLDEMRLEKFFSKTSQRRFCWQDLQQGNSETTCDLLDPLSTYPEIGHQLLWSIMHIPYLCPKFLFLESPFEFIWNLK